MKIEENKGSNPHPYDYNYQFIHKKKKLTNVHPLIEFLMDLFWRYVICTSRIKENTCLRTSFVHKKEMRSRATTQVQYFSPS